jgi:hypothetical protein
MIGILRFVLATLPCVMTIAASEVAAQAFDRATPLGVVIENVDERGLTSGPRAKESWSDYRAIMWHPPKVTQCAALKELGIDAGAVIPENRERPAQGFEQSTATLRDWGLAWYVENIATDFYSAYHRHSQGKPVNWRFVEVKEAYRANPADPRAFERDPSLSDPDWQALIRERLMETVRRASSISTAGGFRSRRSPISSGRPQPLRAPATAGRFSSTRLPMLRTRPRAATTAASCSRSWPRPGSSRSSGSS